MKRALLVLGAASIVGFVACDSGTNPNEGNTNDPHTIQSPKLKVGMWWNQTMYDTTHASTDSSGNKTTTQSTELHHTYNKVNSINQGGDGAMYYTIQTSDTLIDPQTGNALSHSDSELVLTLKDNKVQYVMAVDTAGFTDSVAVTYLELPVSSGKTWQMADLDFDTVIYFPFVAFNIRMRALAEIGGPAVVNNYMTYAFGNRNLGCYSITSTIDAKITVVIDTTIAFMAQNIVTKGDTALYTTSKVSMQNYLSTDFTVPLKSQQTTISYSKSKLDESIQRDTTKSLTVVTKLYDVDHDSLITR